MLFVQNLCNLLSVAFQIYLSLFILHSALGNSPDDLLPSLPIAKGEWSGWDFLV